MQATRNVKNKIRSTLLHPWTLALIVSLLILPLLPPAFDKYTMEHTGTEKVDTGVDPQVFYIDLDKDRYSEKIVSYQNHQGNHSLQIFDHMGGIHDQWNFRGSLPGSMHRLVAGDYDEDEKQEIYVFTVKNDSIFLHAFEPLDKNVPLTFREKFITRLSTRYATPDVAIINPTVTDIDNDGRKELYFVVACGYSKFPRRLFIYDIREKKLSHTPDHGSVIGDAHFIDLDGDGRREIIGSTPACGNVPDSLGVPYSDYSAWFMIFNSELEKYLEPVEFKGFGSRLSVRPFRQGGNTFIAVLYNHVGAMDNYPLIRLYDHRGRVVREKRFPLSDKSSRALLTMEKKDGDSRLFLLNGKGTVAELNAELDTLRGFDLGREIQLNPGALDLDGDGEEEYVFSSANTPEYMVTRQDLSHPVTFEHGDGKGSPVYGIIDKGGENPVFYHQRGGVMNFYRYGKNPLYYYRYLVYVGIFAGVLLFIHLIRRIQLMQIRRQGKVKARIQDLQLRNIKAQMDPHFTFNMFNTVAAMIRKEDKEDAYRFFVRFANLIRSNLTASTRITRTLNEELEHVRNYIELEKERYRDKFDFEVNIAGSVDLDMQVPKMVLQIFVENALKHGVLHMDDGRGRVMVNIHRNARSLVLEVEDNGVGREKAGQYNNGSTGMGIKIVDDYFRLFNQRNDSKLSYHITDLYDEQRKPRGTRVEVMIPYGFEFREVVA